MTTVSPNAWCEWWKVIKYSLRAFIRDLRGFVNNVREVYKNVGDNSKNLRRFLEKVQRFSRNLPRFLRKVPRFFWGMSYFLLLGVDNVQCSLPLPPIHTPHFYPFSARFFTFLGGIIRERNKLFRIKVVSLSSNIRFTTNEFTMRHRRTSQRGQVHAF